MSSALILGYGFTAWSIDSALSEEGFDVYGLRRNWEGPSKNSYSAHELTGDITQPTSLEDIDKDFDLVVNCVSSGDRGNEERYREVYQQGAENVISWARNHNVKQLIYTGSSSVYGNKGGDWVDESTDLDPTTTCGEILVRAEETYRQANKRGDLNTVICRLTGIYGPSRHRVLNNYLNGTVTLRGQGKRYRNMIRREDIGEMIKILATTSPEHHCYNLTDSKPTQERDFFEWLSEQLDQPMPELSDQPLRRSNKRVSNERFITEFNHELKFPTYREGYKPLIETAERQNLKK